MTKAQKILSKKAPIIPVNPLAAVQFKIERVKELRAKLASMKALYIEHDTLMEELMPMFISVEPDKFTINRELNLGGKKYRITPHFFDTKKGIVTAKNWKSTAFESISLE